MNIRTEQGKANAAHDAMICAMVLAGTIKTVRPLTTGERRAHKARIVRIAKALAS